MIQSLKSIYNFKKPKIALRAILDVNTYEPTLEKLFFFKIEFKGRAIWKFNFS